MECGEGIGRILNIPTFPWPIVSRFSVCSSQREGTAGTVPTF